MCIESAWAEYIDVDVDETDSHIPSHTASYFAKSPLADRGFKQRHKSNALNKVAINLPKLENVPNEASENIDLSKSFC